jgi:hypothetical protein
LFPIARAMSGVQVTDGRVTTALLGIVGLVAAVVVFALLLRSDEAARRFGLLAGRVASQLGRAPALQPGGRSWAARLVRLRRLPGFRRRRFLTRSELQAPWRSCVLRRGMADAGQVVGRSAAARRAIRAGLWSNRLEPFEASAGRTWLRPACLAW